MTPKERERVNTLGPSVPTMMLSGLLVLALAFLFFWLASPHP